MKFIWNYPLGLGGYVLGEFGYVWVCVFSRVGLEVGPKNKGARTTATFGNNYIPANNQFLLGSLLERHRTLR